MKKAACFASSVVLLFISGLAWAGDSHKADACGNNLLKKTVSPGTFNEVHWDFDCYVPARDDTACGFSTKAGKTVTVHTVIYTVPPKHSLSAFVTTSTRQDAVDKEPWCASVTLHENAPNKNPTLAVVDKICTGQTAPALIWNNPSGKEVKVYLDVKSAWFQDWRFTGEYIIAPLPPTVSK